MDLKILSETAAQGSRPEVLFAEVVVAGSTASTLASRRRGETPWAGIALVALTASGDPTTRRRVREAGYHHHLVKPVEPDSLRTRLDSVRTAGRVPLANGPPARVAIAN